ncbi:hypothetical protein M3F63_03520 [Brachybacterium muris]|uniref:hypothetical protein n=1 Tax=Brachybacterium muris TaxID=219301 RepID=UPI00223B9E3A|nr:hypothetical protein [Brachybacterium muris]MCT2176741.1 hypothetical protein [Brachybacterium muris]
MGTWGTGIFDNDDAGDVREEFRDLIAAGKSADEATAGLVESYGAADVDLEDHNFWPALAATQHSPGHVGTGVIERAITIIDDPAELERWDPSDARRRRAALKKLRSRLQMKPRSPSGCEPAAAWTRRWRRASTSCSTPAPGCCCFVSWA